MVTASSFGAVAQTETYKDVILDGKPARLNVKTGEITHIDGTVAMSLAAKKIKDSVKASNTVIRKNSITFDSKLDSIKKVSEAKLTGTNTNSPDTLVDYYKNQKIIATKDSLKTLDPVFLVTSNTNIVTKVSSDASKMSESELLKIKEKSTSMVYEVSKPVIYDDNSVNYHTVLKGETLYALSKQYNTSLGALKKANNLETTLINIGQILRIKNFDDSSSEKNFDHWTVSKGDTLYSIAKRNNTTVASIKSLNGLVSNLIKIGQTLQIK